MTTPACSQCYRRMVYTDKGWTCPHRATQPPTDQGDDTRQQLSHYMGLYAECRAERNLKGMRTWLDKAEALIAREREAANLNGYKNGISVGAVIAKQAIEDGREPLTAADQFITDLDTPNQQETKHE